MSNHKRMGVFLVAASIVLLGALTVGLADDAKPEKTKLEGFVTKNDGNAITVRDVNGKMTVVQLTDETNVKAKDPGMGLILKGKKHAVEALVAGLEVEVWGTVGADGGVTATKVEFSKKDMNRAQAIQAGMAPVEERTGKVEGRTAAVEGRTKAVEGRTTAVEKQAAATEERIDDITNLEPKQTVTVNFELNSANLSAEAKSALDTVAGAAKTTGGSVLEIRGFADATGKADYNTVLSKKRAEAVSQYLTVQHDIPIRRIVMPAGYGSAKPVADNATEEGRAENRRVEVRLLVSKGLQKK